MRSSIFVLCSLVLACGAEAAPGTGDNDTAFNALWHDGRAELDGYRLTVDRYGQPRHGQAVMIFVTEPFSESRRVKVDDPSANPGDTFDALKLNLVRDFQTGIYDYNTMSSLFVRTANLAPVKESFTSAEWCGHVYQEMIFGPRDITQSVSSYFDGESSSGTIPNKPGGIPEDSLFILLRGLKGDFLAPGGVRKVEFLPSPYVSRLGHRPIEWTSATIERSAATEEVVVPAGRYPSAVYHVSTGDGRQGTFWIEAAPPHRVARWEWKGAGALDSGELTGSARLEYWKLHANGDEKYLKDLGLEPSVR